MSRWLGLTLLTLLATGALASAAQAQAPLDIPVPREPIVGDLVSHKSGDADGLLPGAGACRSARHRPISLPADDAPHRSTYLEWWWWRGHLTTADGRRLGIFMDAAAKPWAGYYGFDYSITDLSKQSFHYGKQPYVPGWLPPTRNGFRLKGRQASATGGDGRDRLHIELDGYELDLRFTSTKPPTMGFGGDGYLNAYCNTAYVYSRPRMRIRGTLRQDGRSVPVRGTGMFDHNWGFGPGQEIAGWDWLNFELDDGRDISIATATVPKNGELASVHTGSISDARGRVTTLHRGDFSLTPTRYWRRDETCSYPVEWDVRVKGLRLHVRALLDANEVRTPEMPQNYALWPGWPLLWDGPTVISGDATGRGWNDLGHYCAY
jgi:predicted secreted hydrolase